MNSLLAEAVAQLGLQPGQTYRTTIDGREIEVSVREAVGSPAVTPPPADEPSPFADMVMLEPWFEIPPPPAAGTIRARFGVLPLPDPPIIPPDDEVEE